MLVTFGRGRAYGMGRLFLQGPSEFDLTVLVDRGDPLLQRLAEEEEGGHRLEPGEWACYGEAQSFEEFMAWLNVKGHREVALKNSLGKWLDHVVAGMKKRTAVRAQNRSS